MLPAIFYKFKKNARHSMTYDELILKTNIFFFKSGLQNSCKTVRLGKKVKSKFKKKYLLYLLYL